MLISEQWKPVVDFPGYEVSTLGRVRSRRRLAAGKPPRILRPGTARSNGNGKKGTKYRWQVYSLQRDRRGHTLSAHRIVLTAFVGPRPPGMEARHINGDALDNRLNNLRWGTKSENAYDTVRHGTHNRQAVS